MQYQNQSRVSEFFLQGISDNPNLQSPLFFVFLLLYLLTLIANLLIFTILCFDNQLHKPMYFFLCNLSFLDMTYASITQPRLLSLLLMDSHKISFVSCVTQLYLFLSLAVVEFFFLTVMGYDRYVAICKPLQYPLLMNSRKCFLLAMICWAIGFLEPVPHSIVIAQLPFCGTQIDHFYCDYSSVVQLSCIGTFNLDVLAYIAGLAFNIPSFALLFSSYVYIISTIMKMRSLESKYKTFSTCIPHITVVILYYSTILTIHMIPSSKHGSKHIKTISIVYTVIIPSVNPFIYTLRNKDVKQSLQRIRRKLYLC